MWSQEGQVSFFLISLFLAWREKRNTLQVDNIEDKGNTSSGLGRKSDKSGTENSGWSGAKNSAGWGDISDT